MRKLLSSLVLLFLSGSIDAQTYITKDTSFLGWNARVSYIAGNTDSTEVFININGLGEVGTDTTKARVYGPHYWLYNGWNGSVYLGNGMHYPVYVTLQQPSGYQQPQNVKPKADAIFARFKAKRNARYAIGLSNGGWVWHNFTYYEPSLHDHTYQNYFTAIASFQGQRSDDGYGADPYAYPNYFGHGAKSGSFKFLAMEQVLDGRGLDAMVKQMIDSVGSNSRFAFFWTNFGSSGHTNFNDMYNPAQTNWTLTNPDVQLSNNASLNTIPIAGGQNVYQWMLRQGDTSMNAAPPEEYNPCNQTAPVIYNLGPTAPGEIYITNAKESRPWLGGDTLNILPGTYTVIHIDSLRGDSCRPLIVRLPTGVVCTGPMRFNHAYDVKFCGGDSSQNNRHFTGVKTKMLSLVRVRDIDITGFEIGPNPDGVGIYCKQDVDTANSNTWRSSGFVMKNIKLKEMWIHDVEGEGAYIGHTSFDGDDYHIPASGVKIPTILLDSIEISNWYVENTGWDGIQLSGAQNGNLIHHNTVKNFGLNDISGQRAGILSGGGSNVKMYNNTITNGTGNGIQVFGYGLCEVYNNVLDSCGRTADTGGDQSIYCDDRPSTTLTVPGLSIDLHHNTITQRATMATGAPAKGAISIPNGNLTMTGASVHDNIFTIPYADAGTWVSKFIALYPGFTFTNNTLTGGPAGFQLLPYIITNIKFK